MALWQSCLPLLAVAASPMMGMDLAVCSDRPAAVDSMTEMEVRKELTRIARRSGLEVRFGPCSRETAIRIHLLSGGSPDEPTALGAARTARDLLSGVRDHLIPTLGRQAGLFEVGKDVIEFAEPISDGTLAG